MVRTVTVKLPKELLEGLDRFAVGNGLTRSEVIRKAIETYIRKDVRPKKVLRVKRISLIDDPPISGGRGSPRLDICVEHLGKPCWTLDGDGRRRMIVELLRKGLSRRSIACVLNVSLSMVKETARRLEAVQSG